MTSTGTTVHQLTAGNIIVPAIGFAATFAFDFSLPEQVGVVLMAIADWKMSDFKAACAYAASQGWLIVEEDALTLTVGLAAA